MLLRNRRRQRQNEEEKVDEKCHVKKYVKNVSSDLVTSKIFDIQNTLRIQFVQTKKRAPRSQLDTLDFLADRNSKQLPAQPFNGTLFEAAKCPFFCPKNWWK